MGEKGNKHVAANGNILVFELALIFMRLLYLHPNDNNFHRLDIALPAASLEIDFHLEDLLLLALFRASKIHMLGRKNADC